MTFDANDAGSGGDGTCRGLLGSQLGNAARSLAVAAGDDAA
ncbi:hypothetical protein [Leifsonia sp. 2MCAF36]